MPPQMIPLKPKSSLGAALRRTINEGDRNNYEWIQNEQIKWISSKKKELINLGFQTEDFSDAMMLPVTGKPSKSNNKLMEIGKMVTDLMYNMILFKFKELGVEPIGAGELDGPFADLGPVDLIQLTSGIHTVEALEMVRSHLLSAMGPMLPKSNEGLYTSAAKLPKLQLSQVYMTSVMFGYFLRRVDKSYQVAKSMKILDEPEFDEKSAVTRLEGYLRRRKMPLTDTESLSFLDSEYETESYDESEAEDGKRTISIQDYIQRFDQKTMIQSASLMSQEAAVLLQEYQYAHFGNIRDLQKEMAQAIGPMESPQPSQDQIVKKITEAVENDIVQTIVITFADQRRLILEAVAFGSFLREVEDHILKKADEDILTPLPQLPLDADNIRGMLPGI